MGLSSCVSVLCDRWVDMVVLVVSMLNSVVLVCMVFFDVCLMM